MRDLHFAVTDAQDLFSNRHRYCFASGLDVNMTCRVLVRGDQNQLNVRNQLLCHHWQDKVCTSLLNHLGLLKERS